MRFHADGPSIPDTLLERCDVGRVVFLCGAGVSLPSGMPTFIGLTQYVIEFFDPPPDSEIMAAFRPWLDGQSAANVPLDQIFNLLQLEYGKDEVNALVTQRLSAPLEINNFGREHALLKRISSSQNGVPQIVTTNFDQLFEAGQEGEHLDLHLPPAFPDLNFGSGVEGITYLHGRLVDGVSENHPYVLSSADFGRAYLSEGWATNFIRNLLERYTVVLVGYQAEDPPIKYLLQGLNHDGKYDRSKLYAFDRGLPEEIEAKWRDRGVTAIGYSDHSDLWKSMESWADRADDPRGWRLSIIAKCQQDPKDMAPHERGQVAHVLRTVQGARLFSEIDPAPHPEWVCVLDSNVRSAKQVRGYADGAEIFDPCATYGLDDDLKNLSEDFRRQSVDNDNLLVWRDQDDSPNDFYRLGGFFETLPKRLSHLATWIGKSINSPVLAWWAIRQNGLHPRLLQHLESQVINSNDLNERARRIWNLIFEHHRDFRNRQWNGEWFELKHWVNTNGWTPSVLRKFRRVSAPRIEIKLPYGVGQSRPPSTTWEKVHLGDIGQFEVVFLERHNEGLDVPDDLLPQVFGVLEEQLIIASGLLEDIEIRYFDTPTCYPDRELNGSRHVTSAAEFVCWFIHIFDRMAAQQPKVAHARASCWPTTDQFFFRKLKLYALSKVEVFEAEEVAKDVLSLTQETFWETGLTRELLFLLRDRWKEFSQASRNELTDRILAGPDQTLGWSNEEFPRVRDEVAAKYSRYLELQGCDLTADRSERLAAMIGSIAEWSDSWARSTVVEHGVYGGWVHRDEKPDSLMNLPVNEVLLRASEELNRDFDSLIEKRPFTGLVKANPRKALAALTLAGRNDDYPTAFWSSMISDLPTDITPTLKRLLLKRLARLPYAAISDIRHTLARWLEQNFVAFIEVDGDLGWVVYDHIIEGFLAAGANAAKSGLGEVHVGRKVIQRSRRTFDHALNGPIGMCVAALFQAVPGTKQEAGSLIPDHIKSRVERLLAAPGEGSDHAVSIACSKLNWLMFVDPGWTADRFVPMLSFDHPAAEPAWSGLLYGQVPSPSLAAIIKPTLLHAFPWIEGFSWDRDRAIVAAQWLGHMRVFNSDKQSGLSRTEMRSALRAMSDEVRNQFIFWLSQVGQHNENGWVNYVIPLVNDDWPKERRYRTSASMRSWVTLLDNSGDSFPAVYEAVKKFLVPVETTDGRFFRFTREGSDSESITALFPEVTLDLMNRVTPQFLTRPPYELPKVLALVAEAKPYLISDPRYVRLIDLVERS